MLYEFVHECQRLMSEHQLVKTQSDIGRILATSIRKAFPEMGQIAVVAKIKDNVWFLESVVYDGGVYHFNSYELWLENQNEQES